MNIFSSIETLDFSVFCEEHELRLYPNWMLRYFDDLTLKEQWAYFLEYRSISNLLYKEDYLIDQLKWILKGSKIDLAFDFYVQLMFDPEADMDELFKPGSLETLYEKFNDRFNLEYAECFIPEEPLATPELPLDFSTDSLPF
jgi:hypothetical protein